MEGYHRQKRQGRTSENNKQTRCRNNTSNNKDGIAIFNRAQGFLRSEKVIEA